MHVQNFFKITIEVKLFKELSIGNLNTILSKFVLNLRLVLRSTYIIFHMITKFVLKFRIEW